MARKIYKTKRGILSYSTGLIVKGKKVFVTFSGGVAFPRFIPSTHIEENEDVQNALEKSASFGNAFELAHTFKKAAPAVKTPEEKGLKKIHQVTNINQAITNLIKNGYLGEVESLVDIDSIQSAAETIGVIYTKLK